MRRKAYSFTAPARVVPELVVGVVVATGEFVSIDSATLVRSTQAVAGHLRVLGLELIPAKTSRRWWRHSNRTEGGSR